MQNNNGRINELIQKMYLEEKTDPEYILRELYLSYVTLTNTVSDKDSNFKIKSLEFLREALNLII